MSRRRYSDNNSFGEIVAPIVVFYLFYLLVQYLTNRANFWKWLIYGLIFVVFIVSVYVLFNILKEKRRQERIDRIFNTIKKAGLEAYVKKFITNFGLGQEKSKYAFSFRGYNIDWNRIHDLQDHFLKEKNIVFSDSDISTLLRYYIEEREREYMAKNIQATTAGNFKDLNGKEFEKLLYRLYTAMGYTVELTGKVGDQGGDLVAIKEQEKILIQAKCWQDSVPNKAVQEVVAAKKYYDCNRAIVVAISDFTKEATELAKVNNVELINKKMLQKMLLDHLKENWN